MLFTEALRMQLVDHAGCLRNQSDKQSDQICGAVYI